MKGLRSLAATTLALFLVFSFMGNSSSAPQRLFERRNWTPQAMLYLKGALHSRRRGGPRGAGRGAWTLPSVPSRAWLSRGLRPERPKPGSPAPAAASPLSGVEAARRGAAEFYPGSSRVQRALSPVSRLCRGAPLHLGPESEEGPLRPAAAGEAKSKCPTANSSRGSRSAVGFLAEATRSCRRKL